MPLPQENKKYTYKDYMTWPDDERWEIIDGIPYMQAAPSWQHQAVLGELYRQFSNYFVNKSCKAFSAPFDVCLEESEDSRQVVQPDIVIVCNQSKLKGTGYFGVPSLIVEIISPSTAKVDRVTKFNKYRNVGVKEYWIVEPTNKIIQVFTLLDNKKYEMEIYEEENKTIDVNSFPGLEIDITTIFPE